MAQEALLEVLRESQVNNRRQDLTGILLYAHERFFQVLEGPREVVKATAARIARDERHTGMQVLLEEPIRAREYGQWAMGFVSTDTIPPDLQPAFTRMLLAPPLDSGDEPSHKVLRLLLKTFRHGVL
jgi:hypothetical protein